MIDHKKALATAQAGGWDEAHEMVQDADDTVSCLIHGLLHRIEGDMANAGYWYQRAGEVLPGNTVEEEFARLGAKLG